jgi:hypothetical protein
MLIQVTMQLQIVEFFYKYEFQYLLINHNLWLITNKYMLNRNIKMDITDED